MKDIKYYEIHEELIKFLLSKKIFYKTMFILYNIGSYTNKRIIGDINDLCLWSEAYNFLKLKNLKEIPWSALHEEYYKTKTKINNTNICTVFFIQNSKKDCKNCNIRYKNICKNWFINVNNF